MKKTLLIFTLCASMFGFKAFAQEPYTLTVFDEAVYYSMYHPEIVDEPLPEGAIRNSNSSYGKMLTEDQITAIGNRLTINVYAEALCDDYDRIGKVNLVLVPKGSTAYVYNNVRRIEVGRFITPFMNNITNTPTQVPFTFEADNITNLLHDTSISVDYDFWLELEIYGYQGDGSAGAVRDFPRVCPGRIDVYKGTLELVSENDPTIVEGRNYFQELAYDFQLKDYVLATATNNEGTDEIGETRRTISFTLPEAVTDAKFYLITSNHGSNTGGEEYIRRYHYIYLDNIQKLRYRPGENCEPYRIYNTMPNGIYGSTPLTAAEWAQFSNWCPGAKIPIRAVELGDLAQGEHSFKINVPAATFYNDQGYFPMSVYVQGTYASVAGSDKFKSNAFTIAPNPVNDVAIITVTNEQPIKAVSVTNTLGQLVMQGNSTTVNMASLQSGIYIVKVQFGNNQVATKKIIKK